MVIAIISLVTFTARARWAKHIPLFHQDIAATQPTPAIDLNSYVRRGRLRPGLRDALNLLGDRLEKPGKERLVSIGTVRRESDKQAAPLRLISEWPGRMRFEEGAGNQLRVIGFDGSKGWALGGDFNAADQGVIETLVFDTVDHLLVTQIQGFATRLLGQRFRLDDGSTARYGGPYYDIFEVNDRIGINSAIRSQPKLFYVNSDTLLVERVSYQIERDGRPVKVEILFAGWNKGSNQQLPGSITRIEDGAETLKLTIDSATIGPRLADNIFTAP